MSPADRKKLVNRLVRSFDAMPRWAKIAVKHAMGSPTHHPDTGKEFETFREVLEASTDLALDTLRGDFEANDDLLPEADDD